MGLSETFNNRPSSEVNALTEKANVEPVNVVTADPPSAIPRNTGPNKINSEGSLEIEIASGEENDYPYGITFMLLTIGLMAVVLVLALDNYITCRS